jgi:hypothetical protein
MLDVECWMSILNLDRIFTMYSIFGRHRSIVWQ